ncbi:DUF87 domain-containing protein [Candidatus Woesearchaeota archaeon]|nr:DUF87 domain-containing protein [Candidatus Woesearchaeota archaeon]
MDALIGNSGNSEFKLPLDSLKKHFIALGGSGSGKTVLCKVLIEEASKNKVKSIIIDSQGDLASLALNQEKINANVVIYTPSSSKGIPLCINPLTLPKKDVPEEELIQIINSIASSICKLLGYNLEKDSGKEATAFLYEILHKAWQDDERIDSFEDLIENIERSNIEAFLSKKEIQSLIKKIKLLTIGEKKLLFNNGVKLDIDGLLKNNISIIYLNTLNSMEDKDFLVSCVAKELYQWMLSNPSRSLNTIFYIDEISTFLPAGTKTTGSKNILNLLYKQARKYGIGCIISTQNPGDIDYKAFAQFGTWAIGRLTVKQDREKIKTSLKSVAGDGITEVIETLPQLKPGEFMVFSPDNFETVQQIKVRWLYTDHKTLTPKDVQDIMNKTRHKHRIPEKKTIKKSASVKHLPLNIDENEIKKVIEKNKKRLLKLGPKQEKLENYKLKYTPFFKTIIKVKEKKLLGLKKDINEYEVYFSAIDGSVYLFKNSSFKRFESLINLGDNELEVIKVLNKKDNLSSIEIAYKLGKSNVSSTLNSLHSKRLVTYDKVDSQNLWSSLVKKIPDKIASVASRAPISSRHHEAEILTPEIDITRLSRFVRLWFGTAEIMSHEIIYVPVYEVKYLSRKG